MTFARTRSVALSGIDGDVVDVEVELSAGLPGLTILGLPDAALAEARDRVRAAIINADEPWPNRRLTANLSPAALRKRGSGFDLALACGVLAATDRLPDGAIDDLVLIGELGLDGRVRAVRGILPAVVTAARRGLHRVVVPAANAAEAALVPDIDVVPAEHLAQLLAVLRGLQLPPPIAPGADQATDRGVDRPLPDLVDVAGQTTARAALEVAAAGGHHLFLHGPPGAGKTMLAERLPGVLPALRAAEALEVTAVHSVAGALPAGHPLINVPPFQAPHHTTSAAALVGGGSGLARPGAVSLAHRGVLFADEAPEFGGGVLDALRQPMESGEIVLIRTGGAVRYPARFLLVLAANPCPCGMASARGYACGCTPHQRRRYLARLSGPVLDRVDIRVEVPPLSRVDLAEGGGEPSAAVRERVLAARRRCATRLAETPWRVNAEIPGRDLRRELRPAADALGVLEPHLDRGLLSARGVDRTLRVAWTIADLAGVDRPGRTEVRAALALRVDPAAWAA